MSTVEMNSLIESHVQYTFEALGINRVLDGRASEMTTSGRTVDFASGAPSVVEGPATRGAESLSGYYLIECDSLDEAVASAERYPMPPGLGRIEVRPCGRSPMPYRIVAADVSKGCTSETDLGDGLLLTLDHRLVPLPDGGTRITHSVSMPRAALEKFGMNFSPDFNASVRATLDRLSDLAVALQESNGKLEPESDIRPASP